MEGSQGLITPTRPALGALALLCILCSAHAPFHDTAHVPLQVASNLTSHDCVTLPTKAMPRVLLRNFRGNLPLAAKSVSNSTSSRVSSPLSPESPNLLHLFFSVAPLHPSEASLYHVPKAPEEAVGPETSEAVEGISNTKLQPDTRYHSCAIQYYTLLLQYH